MTLAQARSATKGGLIARRVGLPAKRVARRSPAVATTTAPVETTPAPRLFTDEEWQAASAQAVELLAVYSAEASSSAAAQATVSNVVPPGRVFSDADWTTAFELAASQNPLLYDSVAVTGQLPSGEEAADGSVLPTKVYPAPPPGRVFSDEEWSDSFTAAAQSLAAVASGAVEGEDAAPAGRVFSDATWADAFQLAASGKLGEAPVLKPKSFAEAMAFAGPGPEIINGRLAMFGFLAGVAAEKSSATPVAAQYGEATGGVLALVVVLAAASLVPLLKGAKAEPLGPLTPQAEKINGRAAMIGLASLLALEGLSGAALF